MESKNSNSWHLKVPLFNPSFNRKMKKPFILWWATLALFSPLLRDSCSKLYFVGPSTSFGTRGRMQGGVERAQPTRGWSCSHKSGRSLSFVSARFVTQGRVDSAVRLGK